MPQPSYGAPVSPFGAVTIRIRSRPNVACAYRALTIFGHETEDRLRRLPHRGIAPTVLLRSGVGLRARGTHKPHAEPHWCIGRAGIQQVIGQPRAVHASRSSSWLTLPTSITGSAASVRGEVPTLRLGDVFDNELRLLRPSSVQPGQARSGAPIAVLDLLTHVWDDVS